MIYKEMNEKKRNEMIPYLSVCVFADFTSVHLWDSIVSSGLNLA